MLSGVVGQVTSSALTDIGILSQVPLFLRSLMSTTLLLMTIMHLNGSVDILAAYAQDTRLSSRQILSHQSAKNWLQS